MRSIISPSTVSPSISESCLALSIITIITLPLPSVAGMTAKCPSCPLPASLSSTLECVCTWQNRTALLPCSASPGHNPHPEARTLRSLHSLAPAASPAPWVPLFCSQHTTILAFFQSIQLAILSVRTFAKALDFTWVSWFKSHSSLSSVISSKSLSWPPYSGQYQPAGFRLSTINLFHTVQYYKFTFTCMILWKNASMAKQKINH